MKIVEINGGLGNQMCQYTFARFLEINFGMEIWFDDVGYDLIKQHNGFELDRVFKNSVVRKVRDNFDADVWEFISSTIGQSKLKLKLPNVLLANDMEISLVADEYWHAAKTGLGYGYDFDGEIFKVFTSNMVNKDFAVYNDLKNRKSLYFMGAWIDSRFCEQLRTQMIHEFQFPELEHETNIQYKNDILSQEKSIGLHIRRGDFVTCNKSISPSKYAKAIKELRYTLIKENVSQPSFYIFSDDIPWCKENKKTLGFKDNDSVVFIEGNDPSPRNYIDMQLMTFCDYLIHNHESSFCLAATFASEKDIVTIPC